MASATACGRPPPAHSIIYYSADPASQPRACFRSFATEAVQTPRLCASASPKATAGLALVSDMDDRNTLPRGRPKILGRRRARRSPDAHDGIRAIHWAVPVRLLGYLFLLLLEEGFGSLREFLWRYVFLVGSDEPGIAGRVFHAPAAIAIEHVRRRHAGGRAGCNRTVVGGVGVWNIDVQLGLRRLALFAGIRDHHAGVTDLELRMHDQTVGPLHRLENSLGPESLLEKLDHLRRAANSKIRRNRVIAIGDGLYRHCRLLDCG